MKSFSFNDEKIYRASYVNVVLKRKYKRENNNYSLLKKVINTNKLNKTFINKELICYIYEELNKKKISWKILNKIINFLPDSFLCAVYLKTILD